MTQIRLFSGYSEIVNRLGDKAGDFYDLMRESKTRDRLSFSSIIREPLRELPQVLALLPTQMVPLLKFYLIRLHSRYEQFNTLPQYHYR